MFRLPSFFNNNRNLVNIVSDYNKNKVVEYFK
ncbi:hypothetical protein BCD_0972 (plasmid) [Borrelia crocidurae DOU]|uniref:Uncharacterized protein n=1 Tax=Borrelia crocidurae DOU TaxID=1293575 RepID=W5SK60_9SPIR|nr:hypothetical protein BCD_0972 [Borrelia crocidurae DOU]